VVVSSGSTVGVDSDSKVGSSEVSGNGKIKGLSEGRNITSTFGDSLVM